MHINWRAYRKSGVELGLDVTAASASGSEETLASGIGEEWHDEQKDHCELQENGGSQEQDDPGCHR
jgi:hypothetical protein